MSEIKRKSGGSFEVSPKGSLGLLALGDIGLKAWNAAKKNERVTIESKPSKDASYNNKPVILIGWDAADWKIINPMLDAGLLPNLRSMINEGVIGNLATLDPPYSPMLWTSIATGKRAYDHGVHGFTEISDDGKSVQPVMSTSRKVKAIWNILSEKNKKCHLVGWWPSHPAENINGICVSNVFQKSNNTNPENWPLQDQSVYPESQQDRFKELRIHQSELTEKHILPFVPDAWKVNQSKDKRLDIVAKITAEVSSLHNVFTNIISQEAYDFAALYLDGIDHYCHGFMKYFPPHRSHISKPDFDIYKHVIRSAYRFHDMMLGRILELAPSDATILLISDHGFQPDHLRPRNIPKEPAGPAHEHSPYGIIVAKGPNIKKDELLFGASVIDITPTILKIFGLPIAKDMEGKVLHNLFNKFRPNLYVDSYESDKIFKPKAKVNEKTKNQLLNHLVELGYIEDQKGTTEAKIKQTKSECDFNLARACIEGGKIKEAESILENLYIENKTIPRYAIRLSGCYQALGKYDKARAVIEHLKNLGVYSNEALNIFDGGILLGNGRPNEALIKFNLAKQKIQENPTELNLQIVQCYIQINKLKEAEECLIEELKRNYEHPQTHQLLATVCFRQNEFNDATKYSLAAIALNYHDVQSHAILGRSLYHIGKYSEAAHAMEQTLKLSPQNNFIRELLIQIYEKQLLDNDKFQFHKEKLKSNYQGNIFVVSGLPRSGTSMLMQMLVNGGLEAFTDNERNADENNPHGYYEHTLVKNLQYNSNWIGLADHKVVKIVAPLLTYLPLNYKYKIVFIERSIDEVALSQKRMLDRNKANSNLVDDLNSSLQNSLQKSKNWLAQRNNIETLYVNFKDIITNPAESAQKLNQFFDLTLDIDKMKMSVHNDLYRSIVKE